MGDGVQKKVAIIINGDGESRHLENVRNAALSFQEEGFDQIAVLNPEAVATADIRKPATPAGLQSLIGGIKTDDDDLIAVYVTGHGGVSRANGIGQDGESCAVLQDGSCLSYGDLKEQLDRLDYGRRIVLSDGCQAGNSISIFKNPNTVLYSLGSTGEDVRCQDYMPHFFSPSVPDGDRDGIVSIEERFSYMLMQGSKSLHGMTSSQPMYENPGVPISLAGREGAPPFQPEVVEVFDGESLDAQLSRLQPGQMALVVLSANWCGFCQQYKPRFEELAREYGGKFLMIRAEGVNGSERDWDRPGWNIDGYPTVAFVDSEGNFHKVEAEHRNHPLGRFESVNERGMEERRHWWGDFAKHYTSGDREDVFLLLHEALYEAFNAEEVGADGAEKARRNFVLAAKSIAIDATSARRGEGPETMKAKTISGMESLVLAMASINSFSFYSKTSVWTDVVGALKRIARHPDAHPEVKGRAKELVAQMRSLALYDRAFDRALALSGEISVGLLDPLGQPAQPTWVLDYYLYNVERAYLADVPFSKESQAALSRHLLAIHRFHFEKVQRRESSHPFADEMLLNTIAVVLGVCGLDLSDPAQAKTFQDLLYDDRITADHRVFLLAGQMETSAERAVENGRTESFEIDLLKLVMHGMLDSNNPELFEIVRRSLEAERQ